MKFTLTQEDLDKGIRMSFDSCAVALALKRHFPGSRIWVDARGLQVDGDLYPHSLSSSFVIAQFDGGGTVKPMEIQV